MIDPHLSIGKPSSRWYALVKSCVPVMPVQGMIQSQMFEYGL